MTSLSDKKLEEDLACYCCDLSDCSETSDCDSCDETDSKKRTRSQPSTQTSDTSVPILKRQRTTRVKNEHADCVECLDGPEPPSDEDCPCDDGCEVLTLSNQQEFESYIKSVLAVDWADVGQETQQSQQPVQLQQPQLQQPQQQPQHLAQHTLPSQEMYPPVTNMNAPRSTATNAPLADIHSRLHERIPEHLLQHTHCDFDGVSDMDNFLSHLKNEHLTVPETFPFQLCQTHPDHAHQHGHQNQNQHQHQHQHQHPHVHQQGHVHQHNEHGIHGHTHMHQPMSQPMSQPMAQSMNQPMNQPMGVPVTQQGQGQSQNHGNVNVSSLRSTLSIPQPYLSPSKILQCHWGNCNYNTDSPDDLDCHFVNAHKYDLNKYSRHQSICANAMKVFPQEKRPPVGISPFLCEWNHCHFSSNDLTEFVSHLMESHQLHTFEHTCASNNHYPGSFLENISTMLPLTSTPSSEGSPLGYTPPSSTFEGDFESPKYGHVHHPTPSTSPTTSPGVGSSSSAASASTSASTPAAVSTPATAPATAATVHTCQWVTSNDPKHVCKMTFSSAKDLSDHVVEDHIGSRKPEYSCSWDGCDRCDRPFTQRQKVVRHLQTHTKHRPHQCPVCHYRFAEESVLKQHMRIHSGEKPFQCQICHKTFAASTALSVHMRIHTGEKPLVCKWPGCGKRFSESSNLTKHMKTHTLEKPFACPHPGCDKRFGRNDQLQRHVKTHEVKEEPEWASGWQQTVV